MHKITLYLECLQVVDEYVWHPEVVDKVQVDGVQLSVARGTGRNAKMCVKRLAIIQDWIKLHQSINQSSRWDGGLHDDAKRFNSPRGKLL